jgi:hypothetical protein
MFNCIGILEGVHRNGAIWYNFNTNLRMEMSTDFFNKTN